MPEITIEEFNPEMTDDTAGVLARAFVINPLNVAAFGVDQVSMNKTSCLEDHSPRRFVFSLRPCARFFSSDVRFPGIRSSTQRKPPWFSNQQPNTDE
jgi:hypothetical protein